MDSISDGKAWATAPRRPFDFGKQLIVASLIFLAGTIILSLVIVYDGESEQPLGQGGGYEPPLCLCASWTASPSEVPSLSPANSPTPAPTNTVRLTSTTVALPTATATQTPSQRPTEAFNTPTPEVWQGGIVPTSIDRGGVIFTVLVPAGVVTHDWNGSGFVKRTIALRQGTAFTVDTGVTPYCRLDRSINVYRVRSQENVWIPWKDLSAGGTEYTRPDNGSKASTEDCL